MYLNNKHTANPQSGGTVWPEATALLRAVWIGPARAAGTLFDAILFWQSYDTTLINPAFPGSNSGDGKFVNGNALLQPAGDLLDGRRGAASAATQFPLYCNSLLNSVPLLGRADNNFGSVDSLFGAANFRPRTVGLTVEKPF